LMLGAPMPMPAAAAPKVAPFEAVDHRCPSCRTGKLVRLAWSALRSPEVVDTS
jgi:uncharacterized protein (DUF983 family)